MKKPEKFEQFLPYGIHNIYDEEKEAALRVLSSDWLTGGSEVSSFEKEFADFCSSKYAVSCCNGTAALHLTTMAIDIKPGDEVIVPSLTFTSTANCVEYQFGKPIFADISPETMNIDPDSVRKAITKKTKAIIAVDYTGLPVPLDELKEIATENDLYLIEDAAHAVGGEYKGKKIGSISDLTTFSFHPVKQMTTGEGGMVTSNNEDLAKKMSSLRNIGLNKSGSERFGKTGSYHYDVTYLGYNYRLNDIQCALGRVQLKKLPDFLKKRASLANYYLDVLQDLPLQLPPTSNDSKHAWHLFVIRLNDHKKETRDKLFDYLRQNNIGVNVHYIPVHFHPYYKNKYSFDSSSLKVTEDTFNRIITLPLHPRMTTDQIDLIHDHLKYFFSNN